MIGHRPSDSDTLDLLVREARKVGAVGVVAGGRKSPRPMKPKVRVLLMDACRAAKKDNVSPERLIVTLKQRWMAAHDGEDVNRAEAQGTLNNLVSACIEAYFDDGAMRDV